MPEQSLLKIIKRWRRYQPRGDWSAVPKTTRGFYILYRQNKKHPDWFEVLYIGVAGLGKMVKQGIVARLRSHHRRRKKWTHYSFMEVHDNVTREDLRELESLFLSIFGMTLE